MKPALLVGCAMWSNRAWSGVDLPSNPSGGDLAAYARVVNAVEGNTTFYAVQPAEVVRRWASAVSDDFRFMFKLPRSITHERKLRGVADELAAFIAALKPCHHLIEPFAVQLPASFGPSDVDVLDSFLAQAPRDFRWAVEVRHPTLFDNADEARRLNDMLHRHDADRIILDSRAVFAGPRMTREEHEAFENKPRLPVVAVATGETPVVRFIGQTMPEANPPYWAPWIDTVARWLANGRRPRVFIHTPDNAAALRLCRQFHDDVRAVVPDLEPLPEPPPVRSPRLFD